MEHLAEASRIPLNPGRTQATCRVGNEPEGRVFDVNAVSPEFFSVLEMPIVRGRVFTDGEPDAALVTESTAGRHWPGEDAIGRTIATAEGRREIVGIVRDAQVSQAREAGSSYVYLPATRTPQRRISVRARTGGRFEAFASAVRAETSRMDPGLVVHVRPLSANVGLLQTLWQVAASVAGAVSLLAVSLAAIGLYGVVAYVVSRRRREVGVRMALGAGAGDVQRLILRQTLRPVVFGMSAGVAGAAAVVRLLQTVLFGISPYDPLAFVGAASLLLSIGALAALIPTRRAIRVDPMSVLRSE